MPFYDISIPLRSSTPSWPKTKGFSISRYLDIGKGDSVNNSALNMDAHTGTHIDAPLHHIEDGDDILSLKLESMIGEVFLADIPSRKIIEPDDLEEASIPLGTKRLLIKTDNSRTRVNMQDSFSDTYSSLSISSAEWIVGSGIKLIGIDSLSIEAFDGDGSVHKAILKSGIIVIEGLDLASVSSGMYRLHCLPLSIENSEGAPARVILEK